MTDHPCKGLSARHVEAFERIATGDALPPMTKAVVRKLLDRGLIVGGTAKQLGDRLGRFSIPQYYVPLNIHARWCEWCSEQPDIVEAAK